MTLGNISALPRDLSVPIQLFIDAQQKSYAKKLRFFLLLKLLYNCGKTKLEEDELLFIEFIEEIRCRKTSLDHIQFLREKGWLFYNEKTGYYLLKSFERIRRENNWEVNLAFQIDISSYKNIKAVTGAVIYGYLHKDFWRKLKRKKSVRLKGSTYHFLSPNFNYNEKPAPVSVLGISKIFNTSPSTATKLKNEAVRNKLLFVQKNYSAGIPNKKAMELCIKYQEAPNTMVFRNRANRFQLIDTVYPLFHFKKLKKWKTYSKGYIEI